MNNPVEGGEGTDEENKMAFFFWIGMPAIFLGILSASVDPAREETGDDESKLPVPMTGRRANSREAKRLL